MIKNSSDLLKRSEKIKQENPLDLTMAEDLSVGIMNLISLEEHLFYSFEKTHNQTHLEILDKVRQIRIDAMKKIILPSQAETWCVGKHLLAASMRFLEIGTKALKQKENTATQWFDQSFLLFKMFWQNAAIAPTNIIAQTLPSSSQSGKVIPEWLSKILSCCKE